MTLTELMDVVSTKEEVVIESVDGDVIRDDTLAHPIKNYSYEGWKVFGVDTMPCQDSSLLRISVVRITR